MNIIITINIHIHIININITNTNNININFHEHSGTNQENHENLEKHGKLKFMNILNFVFFENCGVGIWARDHAKKMRLPPRIRMHRLSAKSELREPFL